MQYIHSDQDEGEKKKKLFFCIKYLYIYLNDHSGTFFSYMASLCLVRVRGHVFMYLYMCVYIQELYIFLCVDPPSQFSRANRRVSTRRRAKFIRPPTLKRHTTFSGWYRV